MKLTVQDCDDSERALPFEKLTPCWLDFYCDWGAEIPLWVNGSGMAYAESVPISAALLEDLVFFQQWFENAVDVGDKRGPDGFDEMGRALLARVRAELPTPWRPDLAHFQDRLGSSAWNPFVGMSF